MATRVTVVNGSSPTGVYAADGSINVVVLTNPTSPVGVYHPCGAFNVVLSLDFLGGLYHVSGAYKAIDLGGGVYAFGPFNAIGTGGMPPPSGWAYLFKADAAGVQQVVYSTDASGISRPLIVRIAA